jgi:hypothetical protein
MKNLSHEAGRNLLFRDIDVDKVKVMLKWMIIGCEV